MMLSVLLAIDVTRCSTSSFFNDPAPTVISTLSLHDALPISDARMIGIAHRPIARVDERHDFVNEKIWIAFSLRVRVVRSEEHTSELQSLTNLVCRLLLEKKNTNRYNHRQISKTRCVRGARRL